MKQYILTIPCEQGCTNDLNEIEAYNKHYQIINECEVFDNEQSVRNRINELINKKDTVYGSLFNGKPISILFDLCKGNLKQIKQYYKNCDNLQELENLNKFNNLEEYIFNKYVIKE